jgi:hypothetical protein
VELGTRLSSCTRQKEAKKSVCVETAGGLLTAANRPANKKLHYSINWSPLFNEMIAVYCDYNTKPTNTLCGYTAELLVVKANGTYSYQRALKRWMNPKKMH